MNREEMEAVRQHNAAIVKDICAQYGMYGTVVYYEPSPFPGSSLNQMYLVAGLDPVLGKDKLPKNLRPDEMLQVIQRNEKLFYPRAWVLDLKQTGDGDVVADHLSDYCEKAARIAKIYGDYGLPAPKVLRESEVSQLITFDHMSRNSMASTAMREKAKKDLNWFFRRETSSNPFRRKWLDYFRSEKFPDDKGPLAKIIGYFRREQCEVSLKQLMDNNSDISKLELQEYEFRILEKLIQERYPFVSYAVGDKDIVDHGLSKATRRDDSPFGKCVTAEEYAVIRKERFAEEGWDCVANLKPAYWEFRDIYYKDCDKPIILSLYQHIALQYAKCDSLGDLKSRGPMCLKKVPANDFMNFVSLAKANKLRFYIDTMGEYDKLSLDTINVLYNEYQQEKLDRIMERMSSDKISFAHVLNTPTKPTLNSMIYEIEEKSRNAPPKKKRNQAPFQK